MGKRIIFLRAYKDSSDWQLDGTREVVVRLNRIIIETSTQFSLTDRKLLAKQKE